MKVVIGFKGRHPEVIIKSRKQARELLKGKVIDYILIAEYGHGALGFVPLIDSEAEIYHYSADDGGKDGWVYQNQKEMVFGYTISQVVKKIKFRK